MNTYFLRVGVNQHSSRASRRFGAGQFGSARRYECLLPPCYVRNSRLIGSPPLISVLPMFTTVLHPYGRVKYYPKYFYIMFSLTFVYSVGQVSLIMMQRSGDQNLKWSGTLPPNANGKYRFECMKMTYTIPKLITWVPRRQLSFCYFFNFRSIWENRIEMSYG